MPLTTLKLHDCTALTDLSPLLDCKGLVDLTVPPNAHEIEILRSLPRLERISLKEDSKLNWRPDKTAAEFWSSYKRDLAPFYARAGRWQEAREAFEEVVHHDPDNNEDWCRLLVLLAQLDDRAAYRAQCHAMLVRFGSTTVSEQMERTAKACLLLPLDDADRDEAIRLANRAAANTTHRYITYFRFAQGLAQYRAGDDASAVDTLAEVASKADFVTVQSLSVLAMAQHRLGRTVEAAATLELAQQRAADRLPKTDVADLGKGWHDVLTARMLLREAQDVVGTK
jgi:tetratricopeptide (TPR) repeat protein